MTISLGFLSPDLVKAVTRAGSLMEWELLALPISAFLLIAAVLIQIVGAPVKLAESRW